MQLLHVLYVITISQVHSDTQQHCCSGMNLIYYGRVRNPKNQLLQIDPPTIVGCSLWYPIARSTMKPEARLLSSQKYRF